MKPRRRHCSSHSAEPGSAAPVAGPAHAARLCFLLLWLAATGFAQETVAEGIPPSPCDFANCDDFNPCTLDVCAVIEGTPNCTHQNQAFAICGDPDATGCNAMDLCGVNGQCIDHVDPQFTVCRAATSICDAPEVCDGIGKTCPADQLTPEEEDCEDVFRDGFELPGSGFADSP